jgi:hypothetical protein
MSGAVKIAAAYDMTCAVMASGGIYCWGFISASFLRGAYWIQGLRTGKRICAAVCKS